MKKYDYISTLAQETAANIVKSSAEWMKYLTTAARLYKYPFCDQLLIYAQRPDATACASMDIWNEKMHCWVNRGASGIALIDESAKGKKLKYVFDVSDVHAANHIGRYPQSWVLEEKHKDDVISHLETIYGGTDEDKSFEERLFEVSQKIVADYYEEILPDLQNKSEGSSLENLDEQNIGIRFKETLTDSIAFMLLSACGVDMKEYQPKFSFDFIHEFDTMDSLYILGDATSELAKPVLVEIGKTVRIYNRIHEKEQEENLLQKGIENTPKIDYNALKRKSDGEQENISEINNKEGGNIDETELRTERRLHDSNVTGGRSTGGANNEVWNNEGDVSERKTPWGVFSTTPEGRTRRAFTDDSETGRGENGAVDIADGRERRNNGTAQSGQSDALGSKDEQYSESGRGNSESRDNLQLIEDNSKEPVFTQLSLFPSFEEQVGTVAAAEASMKFTMPAAFSLQQETIETILRSGGGKQHSRKRIYAKYTEGKTAESMVAFLKKEYGQTGKGFEIDGNPISVWFDEYGMSIGYGTQAKETPIETMNWEDVERHIRSMVENGTYMDIREAYLVDTEERERVANQIYYFWRDGMDETPEEIGIKEGNFPASEATLMELLSDHDGREKIRAIIKNAEERLASGEVVLKWNHVKSPEYLLSEITDLDMERLEFPLPDTLEVKQEDFITQDEIDYALCKGSGVFHGAFRIYDYFKEGHDKKETIDFLKNEYGTGGGSGGLPGNDDSHHDYDSKGIRLEKGSYVNPYAKVLLNWNVVEKRLRELISEDKYLSEEDKEKYLEYKEVQAKADRQYELNRLEHAVPEMKSKKVTIDRRECTLIDEWGTENEKYLLGNDIEERALYYAQVNDKVFEYDYKPGRSEVEDDYINAIADDYINAIAEEDIDRHEAEVFARLEGTDDAAESEVVDETDTFQTQKENILIPNKGNAVNFSISNDNLGIGTPKEKFQRNIEAIRLLEQIESEHRYANPQEQDVLSQYVGWGGLSDAFDESKTNWATEYQELKNLLSPEEYRMARESTLNAHYTSPAIIRSMYEVIERMGFKKGNILEPSMGIGNFFGMMPESMKESRLYGVELDSITGRIARLLYPKADIQIKGFEKTDYPNDFFDIAIGNVPFGQYKVLDHAYEKNNFLIHDYFFAKTLDKVRPGGVVAFITSKGTMDKASPEVRRYLAQRANLLGAVRLPNTAFKANAGTEVTSDILFFQKRDRMVVREPEWVYLEENDAGIKMNSYFVNHPEQIVGKMELVSGPYGMESTCRLDESRPFEEQLKEAGGRITGTIDTLELEPELDNELSKQSIPADPNVKNFSYALVDNEVYYRENSVMKPVEVSDTAKGRIRGMVAIRNCTQELIDMQLNEYGDHEIEKKQKELNELYDDFSVKYGLINSQTNKRAFNQDSSYCLLCSLEKLDDEGNFKGKADMFSKRTIKKAEVVTSVDTASEALAVSLGEKAKVDLPYMEELTGKDIDTLIEDLGGVIYKNPLTDEWETADEYLSGNIREKLKIASTYAENHPEYVVNVQALKQVQPKELDASEIEVRIGATWIDAGYIEDFMSDTFETPAHLLNRDIIEVRFSNITGEWNIQGKNADWGNSLVNVTYGTSRVNAYKIYLQYNTLQKLGLGHFDAWAASFGETQTAIELAPEGTGYRAKTRFAKFFNLPELISLFKESADIQTPDMLNLPVPEAEYENVVLKPSDFQKDMVAALAERAEAVRDKRVESNVDNMLKITNDGRKLALDQRLINDMLPDNDNSKAAACVEQAYKIWKDTMEQRSTQLIFCDLSTPKGDGTFNVYEDVKEKLMDKGVPGNEIAFIHDANTELRKAELFAKVRSGQVRFLFGSTAKMGAGTNVQDRLIALHHLDVPWRPSDIEQQEGRILRQGNQNAKVKIFRYVTEGTFDSYSWQLIENKQKFIGQIMTSKSPVRSCEDVDEAALSYAEVKALATGNPYIKEKMDLDIQVARLKLMKANHTSQKYRLEDNITQHYPQQIAHLKESIEGFSKDIQRYKRNKPLEKEDFSITVCGKEYSDKKEAGIALIAICKESKDIDTSVDVGEYLGFSLKVKFDAFYRKFVLNVKGDMSHPIEIGVDPFGNLTRINNALEAMPAELEEAQTKLSNVEHQLETAKIEVNKPFLQEAELSEKLERLVELDALLNMGEKEDSIIENTTEDIIEPVITPANKFTKRVKPRGPKL